MHIQRLNKPLFAFSSSHPARQFLEAFISCRRNCVGRELEGIEHEWTSADGRRRRFSCFAYENLSFDVELDGWLSEAAQLTGGELRVLANVPEVIALMDECAASAAAEGNEVIVAFCRQVQETYRLWAECIRAREQQIAAR